MTPRRPAARRRAIAIAAARPDSDPRWAVALAILLAAATALVLR